MGLRFTDAASWQRWQASRRRLHVLKDKLTGRGQAPAPVLQWWARGNAPRLAVVCDSNSPTNHHSLLAPLTADPALDAFIIHPQGLDLGLAGEWRPVPEPDEAMTEVRAVASIGDHLAAGAWAHAQARQRSWAQFVVQHGLLTPYSPPPPPGAELLAWSAADADYWTEGRADLQAHVTGSVLLAAAAAKPVEHVSRFERPVFLGQLHGAELSRASMTRSVTAFWRETGCIYRPHPREEDKLSRLQHALWKKMGVEFDGGGALAGVDRPVVSAFSTGILEAAARGVPSWVYHLNPPSWLEEMWERYAISPWGTAPTAPPRWGTDPERRVAEIWKDA